MNFELKKVKAISLPETRTIGTGTTYGIPVIVWAGVVGVTSTKPNGDPEFSEAFQSFCPLDENDGKPIVETKMAAFGAAQVAEKYPNTL